MFAAAARIRFCPARPEMIRNIALIMNVEQHRVKIFAATKTQSIEYITARPVQSIQLLIHAKIIVSGALANHAMATWRQAARRIMNALPV
jgi:hypothetical protein